MSLADGKLDETEIVEVLSMIRRIPAGSVMSVCKGERRIVISLPEEDATPARVVERDGGI